MAGVRGEARNLKVDLKGNAREVLAFTRAMGQLTPAALTTSVVNIVLKGLQQAAESGIVYGYENPSGVSGTWYEIPVPGADHKPAFPTLYDVRNKAAYVHLIRNEKGQIIDRKMSTEGAKETRENYLFRDKWVSRTGDLRDKLDMRWGEQHVDDSTWKVDGTHASILLKSFDGLVISGQNGEALLQTTPDKHGEKIATLEKRKADDGKLQPRYVIRRNLQSVSRRWSTAMKSELKRAEKLAAKAAKAAKDKK